VLKAIRSLRPQPVETTYNVLDFENSSNLPYVLIIDEINRGNIAQIFGELITLIEDDKRIGCKEALEVMLPYSKERFGVPPNLYIIGTMNTADRSVEALDTALRRRFSFQFMPPMIEEIPENAERISLRKVVQAINERLTYLLDADHQIGHSYFMDATTEEAVRSVFKNKIIPLLKEYFYNDYGKIRLVLGDHFVRPSSKPRFAVDDDEIEREIYNPVIIDDAFDIVKALEGTLRGIH
jgi:5-methylcytosine-specific restriction protein B